MIPLITINGNHEPRNALGTVDREENPVGIFKKRPEDVNFI
jgi:hypothetical protein